MRLEGDFAATTETLCRLLKGDTYGLLIAIAYRFRCEAAQFAFEDERSGHRVARAPAADAPNIDARLIVSQGSGEIIGGAEDIERVDGLREVFAWMPRATRDFHVECLVGGSLRDDHPCLEGVIEDNAIADMPC